MLIKKSLLKEIHEALDQLDYKEKTNFSLENVRQQYIKILQSLSSLCDFTDVMERYIFVEENWEILNEIVNGSHNQNKYFSSLFYYGTNFELMNDNAVLITNVINHLETERFTIVENNNRVLKEINVVYDNGKYHFDEFDYEYYILQFPDSNSYNIYNRLGERILQVKLYYPELGEVLCKIINNKSKFKFIEDDEYDNCIIIKDESKNEANNSDSNIGEIFYDFYNSYGICHLYIEDFAKVELIYLVCVAIILSIRD